MNTPSPKSLLLPYQLDWVNNKRRFKIGMWSRQTGKDFSCAAEAVEDCMRTPQAKWTILATGERQALESVDQAKIWAEAYRFAIDDYIEDRDSSEALIKSAEIIWGNGSRLRALPANPATARGLSTNLILTEFAFHEKPADIWRAIYGSITNPLRGGEKKLRIISTPNGRGNKFADLWFANYENLNGTYSCQKVTIHDAVRLGLRINIEELRAGLGDPEGWAQEFECEFIDSMAVLLPYELIATCEHPEASMAVSTEFWETQRPQLFMGIDFGRKKNLSVAFTGEALGDVLWQRECLEMLNTSTPDQVERLIPRIRKVQRVCLDYTGPGVGLGDYLVKEFGEYAPDRHLFGKIELCNFSQQLLCDVFPKLRMDFESKRLRVAVDRNLREDLHAMQRSMTPGGKITYKAPFQDGCHADRAYGAALCRRAWAFGGTSQYGAVLV